MAGLGISVNVMMYCRQSEKKSENDRKKNPGSDLLCNGIYLRLLVWQNGCYGDNNECSEIWEMSLASH